MATDPCCRGRSFSRSADYLTELVRDYVEKAGYFRDASTGLDYADQRYEQPGMGRFMTPDSAGKPRLGDPSSWNRYAYVGGDPINNVDPQGTDYFSINVDGLDYGINIGVSYGDYYASIGLAYANAIIDYYNNLTYQYYNEVSLLQPWKDAGLISGYLVDYWTGTATADSFLPKDSARGDLGKKACYTLLGFDSANAAQSWFDKIRFNYASYGKLNVQNGAPTALPAPANTLGFGTININTDYNWADFSKVSTNVGGHIQLLGLHQPSIWYEHDVGTTWNDDNHTRASAPVDAQKH